MNCTSSWSRSRLVSSVYSYTSSIVICSVIILLVGEVDTRDELSLVMEYVKVGVISVLL